MNIIKTKTIQLLSLSLLTIVLLSACAGTSTIEITIPESNTLQTYTISGSTNHSNRIKVDNILELEINGVFVKRFISNNNLQIPAFSFRAYPGDTITIRGKNIHSLTGCSIGEIYLLNEYNAYNLSQEVDESICFDGEVFYEEIFELPHY